MEGLALSAPVRIAGCDAVSLERSGTLSRGGGVRRGYDGKSTHVLIIIITIAIKSDDGAAGSRSKLEALSPILSSVCFRLFRRPFKLQGRYCRQQVLFWSFFGVRVPIKVLDLQMG